MKKVFLYFIAVVLGVGGILWGMVEHANERTKENIEAHRLVNIELTKRYEECQQKHPIRNKVIPPERTDCEKQVENDKPSIEAKYNYQSPEKSSRCESNDFVIDAAERFVKGTLKAPKTASFADEKTWYIGNCEHEVTGGVDAQNGFGATIRTPFAVRVKYQGEAYENDSGFRVRDMMPEIKDGWSQSLKK